MSPSPAGRNQRTRSLTPVQIPEDCTMLTSGFSASGTSQNAFICVSAAGISHSSGFSSSGTFHHANIKLLSSCHCSSCICRTSRLLVLLIVRPSNFSASGCQTGNVASLHGASHPAPINVSQLLALLKDAFVKIQSFWHVSLRSSGF